MKSKTKHRLGLGMMVVPVVALVTWSFYNAPKFTLAYLITWSVIIGYICLSVNLWLADDD